MNPQLERMPLLLLVIRNLCSVGGAPEDVLEAIEEVEGILQEVQQVLQKGKHF